MVNILYFDLWHIVEKKNLQNMFLSVFAHCIYFTWYSVRLFLKQSWIHHSRFTSHYVESVKSVIFLIFSLCHAHYFGFLQKHFLRPVWHQYMEDLYQELHWCKHGGVLARNSSKLFFHHEFLFIHFWSSYLCHLLKVCFHSSSSKYVLSSELSSYCYISHFYCFSEYKYSEVPFTTWNYRSLVTFFPSWLNPEKSSLTLQRH